MDKIRYLIIGNSVAAVNCVRSIRGIDKANEITIVSDEEPFNYSRPLLCYYLGGKTTQEKLAFVDGDFYERHKVNLILDKRAAALNVSEMEVALDDSKLLSYDRCLISVGGVPIVPPIEGFREDIEGIFTFLKLKEVKRLVGYIERAEIKEAVVLGGGLIGLKAVEGLVSRGIKPTIIELMDRVLANTFDKEASSIIEERLTQGGCKVIVGDTIQGIETKNGRIARIFLRSGKELATSLLILAAGVRPNLELVKGTPIRVDRGILVDGFMSTNVEGVYAAGDCAQGIDFLSKTNAVIAIWPVAARHGRIAGLNMCGMRTEYPGLFAMNSVQLIDIPTISFGMTNPLEELEYEVLKNLDKGKGVYKKIVLRDNRVVGVILLNCAERAGVYGMLIREAIDVQGFKDQLLRDDFGLLVLPKEFRKHLVGEVGLEV
ncbi:MAG: NAD(P)/FAD-dependent oxidoreductase [Deltaproteobacteria bacterium]|nr:MAG: NAD(P)/FAD-dependent oxidoreductase [Deltaproteobacteria bacterium]